MTASDIITELSNTSDDLNRLEYTIVKHYGSYDEIMDFQNFEQFVDCVFDLDIHGWELVSSHKEKYQRYPNTYSFYDGKVCSEFSHKGH